MNVVIEITDLSVLRKFGKKEVEMSEGRAKKLVEEGKARFKRIAIQDDETMLYISEDLGEENNPIENPRYPGVDDKLFPEQYIKR